MPTLAQIKIGESLVIKGIGSELAIKKRLEELGFLEGARIDKLYVGLFGGPEAVRVGGSVIAVRRNDADKIYGDKLQQGEIY